LPARLQPGERVSFEENQPEPAKENRVQKKKLWEAVQPMLKTTDDLVATFKGIPMMTSAGPVTTKSLKGANIS
jgi:aminoacyl tRNA synthase complex-interacting multifunctional protein 1